MPYKLLTDVEVLAHAFSTSRVQWKTIILCKSIHYPPNYSLGYLHFLSKLCQRNLCRGGGSAEEPPLSQMAQGTIKDFCPPLPHPPPPTQGNPMAQRLEEALCFEVIN